MSASSPVEPQRRRKKRQPTYKAMWATTVQLDGGYIPAKSDQSPRFIVEQPQQARGLQWKNPQRGWCNGVPATYMSIPPPATPTPPAGAGRHVPLQPTPPILNGHEQKILPLTNNWVSTGAPQPSGAPSILDVGDMATCDSIPQVPAASPLHRSTTGSPNKRNCTSAGFGGAGLGGGETFGGGWSDSLLCSFQLCTSRDGHRQQPSLAQPQRDARPYVWGFGSVAPNAPPAEGRHSGQYSGSVFGPMQPPSPQQHEHHQPPPPGRPPLEVPPGAEADAMLVDELIKHEGEKGLWTLVTELFHQPTQTQPLGATELPLLSPGYMDMGLKHEDSMPVHARLTGAPAPESDSLAAKKSSGLPRNVTALQDGVPRVACSALPHGRLEQTPPASSLMSSGTRSACIDISDHPAKACPLRASSQI